MQWTPKTAEVYVFTPHADAAGLMERREQELQHVLARRAPARSWLSWASLTRPSM